MSYERATNRTNQDDEGGCLLSLTWEHVESLIQASEIRSDVKDTSTVSARPPNRHHYEQQDIGLLEGGWGRLSGRPLPSLMG